MRWTHAHMSNLMYSADIMFKVLLRAHTQTHTLSHTHTFIAGAEACTAVLGRLGPLPSPLVWRGGVHHPPYGRPTTP